MFGVVSNSDDIWHSVSKSVSSESILWSLILECLPVFLFLILADAFESLLDCMEVLLFSLSGDFIRLTLFLCLNTSSELSSEKLHKQKIKTCVIHKRFILYH